MDFHAFSVIFQYITCDISGRPVNIRLGRSFIISTTPTSLICFQCLFFLLVNCFLCAADSDVKTRPRAGWETQVAPSPVSVLKNIPIIPREDPTIMSQVILNAVKAVVAVKVLVISLACCVHHTGLIVSQNVGLAVQAVRGWAELCAGMSFTINQAFQSDISHASLLIHLLSDYLHYSSLRTLVLFTLAVGSNIRSAVRH